MGDYLQFYKEEIKIDDQPSRLQAVSKTVLIAHAIGPKRTVEELIPFLFDISKQDTFLNDDEFLFRLGEQYIQLMDFTGGNHTCLVSPIEWLAYQEETVIRDKAIQAFSILCDKGKLNPGEDVLPVLQRLTSAEWFTARLSVCALFNHLYTKVNDTQKSELRKLYAQLAADETPMVRRAAALKLKDFCSVIDKANIIPEIIPVYKQLAQDDTQDVIRVACVHTSLVLIEHHFRDSPEDNKTHTLLVITNSSEDRSWRVRLTIAQNFDKISTFMGAEMTSAFLINPFVALMKDSEQEVRSATVQVVSKLAKAQCFTQEQFQNYIVPQFQSLALDPSQLVRSSLAGVIAVVATTLGRDLTQRLLLNSISDLMKDEFHEVRLHIVSDAAEICSVLGLEVLAHSLLNTIQSLVMDNQWRIRKSVLEQVPDFARQFGPEMFHSKLETMFLNSLSDSVHAVRNASIGNMAIICKHFGAEWTVSHLLPKITDQYSNSAGFSTRLTILHSLAQLAGTLSTEQVQSLLLPMIIKGMGDNVPNVRYCAAKLIPSILKQANLSASYINSSIKPTVEGLVTDSDPDVQQAAQDCMVAINAV